MVLKHVPQHARRIVVAGAVSDRQFLGRSDLDMVNVVAVPHRLENGVGKPHHQHVLNGLLAKVVIDAVDLPLGKTLVQDFVQAMRARRVRAEGFLDDNAAVWTRRIGQAGLAKVPNRRFVKAGCGSQVVDPAPAADSLSLVERSAECSEIIQPLDVPSMVEEHRSERRPGSLVESLPHKMGGQLGLPLAPGIIGERSPRKADDSRLLGKPLLAVQFVKCRYQFAARQIPRSAEDDNRLGHAVTSGRRQLGRAKK